MIDCWTKCSCPTFNNKKILSGKGKKDDTISKFKICKECWRKDHLFSQSKNRYKTAEKEAKVEESNVAEMTTNRPFEFFGMSCKTSRRKRGRRPPMTLVAATTETINAMCYDSVRSWTAKYEDHSRVKLSAYTVPEDAEKFRIV